MPSEPLILLVEDREDDILLIRKSFAEVYITNPLAVVRSGEEAIAYLDGQGQFARREDFPLPSLVLLDLKLTGIDGFEVLRWARSKPLFRGLSIVVLTASQDLRDVKRAYQFGASSFLIKPLEFEHFRQVSKGLKEHWLRSREPVLA